MKNYNKFLNLFSLILFTGLSYKPVLNVKAQTGVTEEIYYGYKDSTKTFYIASTETPEILSCTSENDVSGSFAGNSSPFTGRDDMWDGNATSLYWVKHVIVQDRVAPTSTAYWFSSMVFVETIDITNLDTSNVTTMKGMFEDSVFWTVDLSTLNTSNVTNMVDMFSNFDVYDHRLNVSNFDTSKVTNMEKMFSSATVDYLDLSSFDLSNVTDLDDDNRNESFFSWTGLVKIETPKNLKFSGLDLDKEGWKEGTTDVTSLPVNDSTSHTYERPYYVISFEGNGGTGTRQPLWIGKGDYYYFEGCFFEAPEGKDHNGKWIVNDQEVEDIEEMNSDIVAKPVWVDHNPVKYEGYAATDFVDGVKDCYYCEYCDSYYETEDKSSLIPDYYAWAETTGKLPSFSSQFNSFKTTQLSNCDDLYTGTDADVLNLIAKTKEIIEGLTYDSNKTLDENRAIIEEKVTALSSGVELTIAKNEAKANVDALIDNTASDELKAYVNEQKALIDNATSTDAVTTAKEQVVSNVQLFKVKEEAKTEVDALIDNTASDELKASVDEQKALIDKATSIEAVNAAKADAIATIQALLNKKTGLSTGAIIGIVAGSVLFACLICYAVMFVIWKKKGKGLKFLTSSFNWINKTILKKS